MKWAWLLFLLGAAPAGKPPPKAPADAPKEITFPGLIPEAKPAAAQGGDTKCGACHVTGSWTEVRFNHDRTGFPLKGQHASTGCKECHPVDFKQPIPRGCVGCHTDAHAGDLGGHCESCHDESTWRSRIDVDAHRRTAFPLLGGHAALPCGECHLEAGARRFTRQVVECGSCHANDYQRTQTTAVNHQALGFDPVECRSCHGALSFKQARFPQHDRCLSNDLSINGGMHSGITCLGCHSTLAVMSQPGACKTGTAQCINCHTHQCVGPMGNTPTDQIHIQKNVLGYRCSDKACYQCHQVMTP